MVWTGSEFAIVWSEVSEIDGTYDIRFCRLDSDGWVIDNPIEPLIHTGENSLYPTVVWNSDNSEYALAWGEKAVLGLDSDIMFVTLNNNGELKDDPVTMIDTTLTSQKPVLIRNGTEYAITWEDNTNGSFAIHFQSGITGTEKTIATSSSDLFSPVLAWTGDGYGIAWYEAGGTVKFTRLDTNGDITGSVLSAGDSEGDPAHPSIAWNGEDFGITWQETTDDIVRIHFILSEALENGSEDPFLFPEPTGNSGMSCLAWNGEYFTVVWSGRMAWDANNSIYFAF